VWPDQSDGQQEGPHGTHSPSRATTAPSPSPKSHRHRHHEGCNTRARGQPQRATTAPTARHTRAAPKPDPPQVSPQKEPSLWPRKTVDSISALGS